MSIFQLPTAVTHLKAWGDRQHQNAGTQQHASIANVTGDQFGNQDIRIPFQVAGNRWWLPSKSYVRIRVTINRAGGFNENDLNAIRVAPAQGFASCLFQSCEFAIRGVTVSRLSNYVTQVDQYIQRTKQSAAGINTALDGMGLNEPSWDKRREYLLPRPYQGISETRYFNEVSLRLAAGIAVTAQITTASTAVLNSVVTFANAVADIRSVLRVGDMLKLPVTAPSNGAFGQITALTATTATINIQSDVVAATSYLPGGEELLFTREVQTQVEQVGSNQFDILWQPPLSIFGIDHALPSMACELVLKGWPAPQHTTASLGTRPAGIGYPAATPLFVADHLVNTQPKVTVDQVYFYSYQVVSDRMSDGSFFLDLEDTNCIAQNLPSISANNLTQLQYLVHPSTFQLGVALQNAKAGITSDAPMAQFNVFDSSDVADKGKSGADLDRLYLQYANMTFPQPDVSQGFEWLATAAGRKNQLRQQWLETQMATNQLFQPGGCETFERWLQNGPLYVYQTQRDADDRSTNVAVNIKLAKNMNANISINCLLFSVSRRAATIHVSNGSVTEVLIQDQ